MDDSQSSASVDLSLDVLGARVAQQRRLRGWTLDGLGARTGLSPGFLSRLESGGRQPSLSSLISISSAMGTTVSNLLGEDPQERAVVRIEPGHIFGEDGFQYQKMSSPQYQQLSILQVTIHPNRAAGGLHSHPGMEWIYALEGKIDITINDAHYVLDQGHALQFNARLGHRFDCPGQTASVALLVSAPEASSGGLGAFHGH